MRMHVAVASDHAGFWLKEKIANISRSWDIP